MRAKIMLLATLLIGVVSGFSQTVLLQWSFGTSSPDAPTANATNAASNVTGGTFTYNSSSGGSGSLSNGSPMDPIDDGYYFKGNYWRAVDTSYFSFTVTPTSGYELSLTSISFNYLSSSTGPNSYSLASSVDSYGTPLASGSLTQAPPTVHSSDWHTNSPSIALAATSPTTIRLSASGASSASGVVRVDRVTINGTVTAVPEPSTYGAMAGVLALAWAVVRRRRRTGPPGSV